MLAYILKRIGLAIPTLILVGVVVFALIRFIPGDPAQIMLGEAADASAIAEMHHQMGLDKPLAVQFAAWFGKALSGDLGRSIVTGEPVAEMILQRFQLTATVVLVAVFLATLIAIMAGLVAAWRQD